MNWPFGWELPSLIVGATIIAVLAGPNLAIAVPAGALAVLAAGFLSVGAWWERGEWSGDTGRRGAPPIPDRFPNGITGSRLARTEVLRELDFLERRGGPPVAVRSGAELERLLGLPAEEFRRLVRERLEGLEGAA